MVQAFSAYMAQRYLVTRWVNLFGVFGIGVAVWALIVVISVFSGFIGEIRNNFKHASPELMLTSLVGEPSFEELAELLRRDPEVASVAPRLRHYGVYFPRNRWGDRIVHTSGLTTSPLSFDYVELIGIDPKLEAETTGLNKWLSLENRDSGLRVKDLSDPLNPPASNPAGSRQLRKDPGILVSIYRARSSRLHQGQQLQVVSARMREGDLEGEPLRIRKIFAMSGSFETKSRLFDETKAILHIEELREMLGHYPMDFNSVDLVSDIAIRMQAGTDLGTAAERLRLLLSESQPRCRVLTWEEQNAEFLAAVDQERGMMKLVLFAVMLIAAFLIYATQHLMVMQKIKDIGILCSMGASSRGVLMTFFLMGGIVAISGCLLGTLSGCLSAYYLNDVNDWLFANFGYQLFPTNLYDLEAIPYELEVPWILQVIAGALTISLLAGLLPARRAARMEPVRALAYE